MYNFYKEKCTPAKMLAVGVQLLIYVVVYFIAYQCNETRNFVSAGLLIGLAVETYLFFAILSKDAVDICAAFFGTWTFSIGVCMFRLSTIQKPWQVSTWFEFAAAPVLFFLAFYFIQQVVAKRFVLPKYLQIGKVRCDYNVDENKQFFLMMICACISVALMGVQYAIKGYFPLFTSGVTDRLDFYTRLIVVISAMEITPPICYSLIVRQKQFSWKVILLWIAIIIPFVTALLRLSRGEYIMAMVIIIPAAYYFSKKKALALVLSIVIFISGYGISTMARNESQASLDSYFQMKPQEEVILPDTPNGSASDLELPENKLKVQLSAIESFTYFYLINGFENYNYATTVCQQYSYGLRHLEPFTVVLRIPYLREKIAELPDYTAIKGNTKCLIGDFYLDFGHWFTYVGMGLWGLIAGVIHYLVKKKPGGISMAVYGVCFAVCVLGFFEPWLSYFQMWMFWGTCVLFALLNCKFTIQKETLPRRQ